MPPGPDAESALEAAPGDGGTDPLDSLPRAFVDRYVPLYGSRAELLANLRPPRPAFRANALRAPDPTGLLEDLVARGVAADPVPWWPLARFAEPDTSLGNLPEHSLGYLYGMDAASLLPVLALEPQPGERLLDLCAAPGSKAGLAAELMANRGLLVANDASRGRVFHLIANLERLGVLNAVATRRDGRGLDVDGRPFHRILVDAPCSNAGKATLAGVPGRWDPGQATSYPALQRQLLERAAALLAPGGVLVYSTCSVDPRENEAVAAWLHGRLDLELDALPVDVAGEGPVRAFDGDAWDDAPLERTLRIHPARYGTEGFFVARFRKRGSPAEDTVARGGTAP